ncbi:hypothetical protein DCCM_2646 [Desulfocucumis palustris]|uniref:Uncharacterized protein n=1 Tax=Desulfocucumis palustris TaxID=1898651 RepID=A0A2L2XC23_9FIRM|nr:hypothetical protein DCCM_2646 [Desulfocucumis palustris]
MDIATGDTAVLSNCRIPRGIRVFRNYLLGLIKKWSRLTGLWSPVTIFVFY